MSVKILTKERLNANNYNKMIIREVDCNYIVNVSGERLTDQYTSLSYKISDNFRKMEDEEKIICIVDTFLRDTIVSSIDTGVFYSGCREQFIMVFGTRKLYLYLENSKLLRTIVKMIKDKYNMDRYKYCNNNSSDNLYEISLNSKGASYGRKCISCENCAGCMEDDDTCPSYIQFKLMYVKGRIAVFDKNFIDRFIYEKLWEYGSVASITEETHDIMVGGITKIGKCIDSYNIICGDLVIKFNCTTFSKKYVFELISGIVNRYNSELKEVNKYKKRQLKMEGF